MKHLSLALVLLLGACNIPEPPPQPAEPESAKVVLSKPRNYVVTSIYGAKDTVSSYYELYLSGSGTLYESGRSSAVATNIMTYKEIK